MHRTHHWLRNVDQLINKEKTKQHMHQYEWKDSLLLGVKTTKLAHSLKDSYNGKQQFWKRP